MLTLFKLLQRHRVQYTSFLRYNFAKKSIKEHLKKQEKKEIEKELPLTAREDHNIWEINSSVLLVQFVPVLLGFLPLIIFGNSIDIFLAEEILKGEQMYISTLVCFNNIFRQENLSYAFGLITTISFANSLNGPIQLAVPLFLFAALYSSKWSEAHNFEHTNIKEYFRIRGLLFFVIINLFILKAKFQYEKNVIERDLFNYKTENTLAQLGHTEQYITEQRDSITKNKMKDTPETQLSFKEQIEDLKKAENDKAVNETIKKNIEVALLNEKYIEPEISTESHNENHSLNTIEDLKNENDINILEKKL